MGYVPDWQRQSHAKAGASKPTQTNSIKSVELFHNAPSKNVPAKRFADGGEADTSEVFKDTVTHADSGTSEVKAPASEAPAKQSFGEAFKSAKDGSTFEWNGKSYKKEYASAPAKKSDSKYDVGTEEDRTFAAPAAAPAKTGRMSGTELLNSVDQDAVNKKAAELNKTVDTSVETNPRRKYATGAQPAKASVETNPRRKYARA